MSPAVLITRPDYFIFICVLVLRNSKFQFNAVYRLNNLVVCEAAVSLHKIHNIERAGKIM